MLLCPTHPDTPPRARLCALTALLAMALLSAGVRAQTIEPMPLGDLSVVEREFWSDPDFKRRFLESYQSETELEPSLSLQERELLVKVFEIINTEDPLADAEAQIERIKRNDKLTEQQKAEKIEQAREQAEEALQAREDRREELDITFDTDGDGEDEPALDVALYEVNRYIESVERKDAISATLYFFTANFHMQSALNMKAPEGEAPRRGDFDDDSSFEQARAAHDKRFKDFEQAQRDKLLKAAEDYETAVLRFEKFRRAWRNLGLLRVRLKQFDEGRKALSRVVALGRNDSDTFGLLGYCYSSLGQHLPAESAYRMANLLDPDEKNWKMGLVRSFFMQKRYGDVVALTGDMINQEPDNADLWMLQANAFIGLQQPMRAAENYEVVDGLGASTVQSLTMLANIYTNQGLHETAVSAYLRALELAGGSDQAQSLVQQMLRGAKVLASQGAIAPAKRMIGAVQASYGEQMSDAMRKDWLKLQARIAVREGASGEEVQVLKRIVELDPLDGEAIILLGQNAARQGDPEQAVLYFQRAALIEAYEADAKIEEARVWVKQGQYNKALPLLRSAQQIDPKPSVQRFIDDLEKVSRSN